MRKLLSILFVAALFLISSSDTSAQIRVNINIGSQPQWGPDRYDYVEYYYLPEAGIYYYAPKAQFIYRHDNRWVYSTRLPYPYRNLNLYSTYKVVINEPRPYLRHNYYQSHYKGYRNYHSKQINIRDSKDQRYKKQSGPKGNEGNRMGNSPRSNDQRRVGNQPQNRNVQSPSRQGNNNQGQKSQGNRSEKGDKKDHK